VRPPQARLAAGPAMSGTFPRERRLTSLTALTDRGGQLARGVRAAGSSARASCLPWANRNGPLTFR
jgi:hypothetical protein